MLFLEGRHPEITPDVFGIVLRDRARRPSTVQETNIFTETITEWMKKHSEDLTSLSSTINTLCAATTCPPDLQGAIGTLNELDSEVARVTDTLTEAEAVVCPSTSCINLDQIWFLEADGCVCASTTVRAVREHASAGASSLPPRPNPHPQPRFATLGCCVACL